MNLAMGYEFSCHGCQKRYPGCHSSCEAYKQEKARYDEKKAEADKLKAIKGELFCQRNDAVIRARRKRRGQHG